MPDAIVSYDPARVQALISRTQSVSQHLAKHPCADPLATEAVSVARLVHSHVEAGWLPTLAAIAASRALLDPVDMDFPACPVVRDAGVITAVVDRLTPAERTYFQGFVDASATNIAAELWLFDAHGDYATDRLPGELTTLDDDADWQWLAQLYLVEQYHRMVADGTVTLQRDGDAYWIDPYDLTDPASTITADIVLAAVMAPGNTRPGGAISEATARTAASPMPAPRPLVQEDGLSSSITGYTRHGLERVMTKDGVGVSARAVLDAVRNPVATKSYGDGRVRYEGEMATVVLNAKGLVVTAWPLSRSGWRLR
jgi:hypothetical protein